MSDDNILYAAQQLLEQNEDVVAAIVENMQLGRMEDSIHHFSVLHKNLVSMSLALDNFPSGGLKPYEEIGKFPDEIMRKDILDEFRPLGQTPLPTPPLVPPCAPCAEQNYSAHTCRIELGHVEPSSTFTVMECQEFLKVSQLLEMRMRPPKQDDAVGSTSGGGMKQLAGCAAASTKAETSSGVNQFGDHKREMEFKLSSAALGRPTKRNYRMWTPSERYTILLGIATYGGTKGPNMGKIKNLLHNRSECQLRSYISKNISSRDMAAALKGDLPPAPANYILPKALANEASSLCASHRVPTFDDGMPSSATPATSQLEPKHGRGNWTRLIGLVEGQDIIDSPWTPPYSSHNPASEPSSNGASTCTQSQIAVSNPTSISPQPSSPHGLGFPAGDVVNLVDMSVPSCSIRLPSILSMAALPPPAVFGSDILRAVDPVTSKSKRGRKKGTSAGRSSAHGKDSEPQGDSSQPTGKGKKRTSRGRATAKNQDGVKKKSKNTTSDVDCVPDNNSTFFSHACPYHDMSGEVGSRKEIGFDSLSQMSLDWGIYCPVEKEKWSMSEEGSNHGILRIPTSKQQQRKKQSHIGSTDCQVSQGAENPDSQHSESSVRLSGFFFK
eukprot:CAMPEP_0185030188 /NCGR_PEP_ID=MMETSP1103-20130426/16981_1 /TAXON_ID=36769 /ORGANISM="Paraphysomonas bandaiensis, Strain Caron Lab Isolate" /LENGTH=610 /DNA_ID=CAMNT_0027565201 /DNA_START=85 /DNA_END=1917 /DNA_ORIENTATION=+